MNRVAIDLHRGLFYALFAIFETLLLAGQVVLWSVDPRRMSGLDDAAGITFWLSLVGLSVVSWLLRRAAPRLARVGAVSVLAGFLACIFVARHTMTEPNHTLHWTAGSHGFFDIIHVHLSGFGCSPRRQ